MLCQRITTRVDRWEVTCKVSSFEFSVFGSEIADAHFTFLRSTVVVHGLHSFTDNKPQPARSVSLAQFRVRPAICVVSPQFQQSDRLFVTKILLTRAVLQMHLQGGGGRHFPLSTLTSNTKKKLDCTATSFMCAFFLTLFFSCMC